MGAVISGFVQQDTKLTAVFLLFLDSLFLFIFHYLFAYGRILENE